MMFLDCPAHLDEDSARRCGLPAEVMCRFIVRSTGGPLEAAKIRCPAGHWFNGPIESLTWVGEEKHEPVRARDGQGRSVVRHRPEEPSHGNARPNTAPAYYLGRPARLWITAMSPRRRHMHVVGARR